ncbi:MAG: hypothetical protein IPH20_08165 [Bacteroidales bacterium]|nr:hypothetical protein [Bacteroidales bacterium]
MNCREAELLMVDFIAKQTPSDIPAALSEHLSSCSLCMRLYSNCIIDFKVLAAGRRIAPDPGFFDKLSVRLQSRPGLSIHKRKPVRRILHYSPVFLTAAASVILGIWIGSKWFILTQAGIETSNSLSSEERSGMVEAFASEMQLTDESTLALESYFIENENSDNYDAQ